MSGPWGWGVGFHYGGTDLSMPVVELAIEAEARGFDAAFVPEHTHIPTSRRTPFPDGSALPGRYLRLWDPHVALSFVAAKTDLVVGTCVALVGQHDPIAYAKAVATLDHQSGGRVVVGIGFGWNAEEFEDHGYPSDRKWEVVAEKVQLMQQLWSNDEASFDGKWVQLSPSWAWPKPVQRPYPPVLIAGFATRPTFRRIVAWGDGWIPMSMDSGATLGHDLERLREAWAAAGRDPARLNVTVMQRVLPGAELRDRLAWYRGLGVNRVLVDLPTEGREVLLPLLDAIAPALA